MVMEALLETEVLKLDPVKEEPEKAAAWATKRARRREVRVFMVTSLTWGKSMTINGGDVTLCGPAR
jgi:hypothetical protein